MIVAFSRVLALIFPPSLSGVFVDYTTLVLTCLFALSLNLSFVHPIAFVLYVLSFFYLVQVICDIYVGKFLLYLASVLFYHKLPQHLRDPISPDRIDETNGLLIMNPLRPASDDQLVAVLRKNLDMLGGTAGTKHVVSILILQAENNKTATFRRYEAILRREVFNNSSLPEDVIDRFFVFQMGGIVRVVRMRSSQCTHTRGDRPSPITSTRCCASCTWAPRQTT